jgi:flagellar biosynthetic protein FliR
LFAIGFPITLTVGFVVLALSLPGMLKPIENFIEQAVSNMHQVAVPLAPTNKN